MSLFLKLSVKPHNNALNSIIGIQQNDPTNHIAASSPSHPITLDVTRTTRNSHKNKSSALMMSSIGINRKNRTQGRKNKRRRRKNLCKFLQVFFFFIIIILYFCIDRYHDSIISNFYTPTRSFPLKIHQIRSFDFPWKKSCLF